ncbi:MAG: hypothetical protein K6A42_03145 [Treponema sp.]|nr:hypothetical protein [Treponema sp.]
MKKFRFIVFTFALALFTCAFICACYTPSPLYGAWSDNAGNKISFADDGSFSATIIDSNQDKKTYSGNYSVIENIISFSKDDGSINSEWDIRGGILYLTWFDAYGTAINLSLYHAG